MYHIHHVITTRYYYTFTTHRYTCVSAIDLQRRERFQPLQQSCICVSVCVCVCVCISLSLSLSLSFSLYLSP